MEANRLAEAVTSHATSLEAQIALTLRLLGGLSTAQVASAFLVAEATMAQRLVRRLCGACRRQYTPDGETLRALNIMNPWHSVFLEPVRLPACFPDHDADRSEKKTY